MFFDNTIWDKVRNDIKKAIHCGPVHIKNFLRMNIKSLANKVTDFCDKEIPGTESKHTYLEVFSMDSALKKMRTIICKCF